jgi:hypothetical protein
MRIITALTLGALALCTVDSAANADVRKSAEVRKVWVRTPRGSDLPITISFPAIATTLGMIG